MQLLMKRFPDPTTPEAQQIKKDFIEGYNLNMAIPWTAAERGYIDAVIQPHETRLLLRKSLQLLHDKQPTHKVLRKQAYADLILRERAEASGISPGGGLLRNGSGRSADGDGVGSGGWCG